MSTRARVYTALIAVIVLAVGGYVANEQFHLFGGVANAEDKDGDKKASGEDDEDKDKKDEAVPVELYEAKKGEISSYIASTANLRALRDIEVATQVEGIVDEVLVEEGDFVRKGQLLCRLDDAQHRINLELAKERRAQANIQLEKARINREKTSQMIENTRTEYERYKRAQGEGLVSDTEVATRKYQLDELLHDFRVSESEMKELSHRVAELDAEIAQSELQISLTRIEAPFAGYITERTVQLGQRARALDPLYKLGSFTPLFADVHLSEMEARQVKPGQQATLKLGSNGDEAVTGRVKRVSPIVDQNTGTVKVTVEVAARQTGFKPGAFVRVALRTDTRSDAILIPKRAVIEEDGEYFVYIATTEEKAERTKITTGYEHEGMVQIRAGVAEGQNVVVAGQGGIKEDSTIKVIEG